MTRALALACLCALLCGCSDPPGDSRPASNFQRVVTLAPGLTELVFEIGAGDLLVGVSAWSDYPREVLELPVVGDAFSVDHERLAMLHPDLLLVWESGTPVHTVDELRRLGYDVAVIRTRGLADIGPALRQIGALVGRSTCSKGRCGALSAAADGATGSAPGCRTDQRFLPGLGAAALHDKSRALRERADCNLWWTEHLRRSAGSGADSVGGGRG